MVNGKRQPVRCFIDTFAIYYSAQDECWIAHSLRTDQFGTGDCVVNALVDGMKAVDEIIELAKRKPGIQVFSDAPPEIQALAQNARKLPDELYAIAHNRLYGDWPEDLKVRVDVESPDSTFQARVREEVPV
jgi:hypothetical protein